MYFSDFFILSLVNLRFMACKPEKKELLAYDKRNQIIISFYHSIFTFPT